MIRECRQLGPATDWSKLDTTGPAKDDTGLTQCSEVDDNWRQLQPRQTSEDSYAVLCCLVWRGAWWRSWETLSHWYRAENKPNLLLSFWLSRLAVYELPDQNKRCSRQSVSCQYCEWPTDRVITRRRQPTNATLPQRHQGDTDLYSFSYRTVYPAFTPFLPRLCVVRLNPFIWWTWILWPLQTDSGTFTNGHPHIVNLQAEVSHEARAVPPFFFFPLDPCGGDWSVFRPVLSTNLLKVISPGPLSRSETSRQTVQKFSLFIFELCAFCS